MSDLSEEAHHATWMGDFEYFLWQVFVRGRPSELGRLSITQRHLDELRRLSDAAGGWVVYDDEQALLPFKAWKRRYAVWRIGFAVREARRKLSLRIRGI